MDRDVLAALAIAAAILVQDDDDEELVLRFYREPRRMCLPTIHSDASGFRLLEDRTFSEHFRMNRTTFEKLLIAVGNHLVTMGRLVRHRTPLDLSLMMSLWIMATQDTFRSVAVKFAVPSRGTVHFHYVTIIEALREMAPSYIQWPNAYERDNIKAYIEEKYSYPGVVGLIDGSHIYITAPIIQHQEYINRFRKHSVVLQAVCDHRKVFRDIYVGEPGSVHDARAFQRSPLSHNLLHDPNMLSDHEHILGDGAYMLTNKLITPYRDAGNLTRAQRRHNYLHAKSRSTVERAFGLLKGKFQRQKLFRVFCHQYLVDTIVASCVLHNFILLDGLAYMPNGQHQPLAHEVPNHEFPGDVQAMHDDIVDDLEEYEVNVPEMDPLLEPARAAGRLKRQFITHLLQQ